LREFPDAESDEVIAQLVDVKRATAAAVPTRWFAAFVDGEPVSVGELYVSGDIAQIEDLATLTAYRNRGLASAVVLRAVEEARGAELVFLIADDDDWPKELYGRLGFDPIGRTYSFLRKPEGS
jgi:predicted GNAT family acetyltransferase